MSAPRRLRAALLLAALGGAALASAGCGGDGAGADGDRASSARPADPPVLTIAVGSGPAPAAVATAFVAARDRVVTVAHVLDEPGLVRVRLPPSPPRRARVVRVDRRLDLALLAVPGVRARRAVARPADGAVRVLVRRGPRPRAVAATIRRHITADVDTSPGGPSVSRPALELAAPILAGDSGAPVVDAAGHLAGVVFARSERRPRTAYAVDAPALAAFLGAS